MRSGKRSPRSAHRNDKGGRRSSTSKVAFDERTRGVETVKNVLGNSCHADMQQEESAEPALYGCLTLGD